MREREAIEQMPKGYVILTEAVHDRDGIEAYGRASRPTLPEHGGRVLVADEQFEVLEGGWHGDRTVVVEFDSIEDARAWYDSEGYRAARSLRQAAADCNVIITSGFVPRAAG